VQIIVCVREALDWNLSTKQFRIDPATHEAVVAYARYQIDQFDEIAVEMALQCRAGAGGTIRALCVGTADSEDALKHALAMQVDAATLVETDAVINSAAPLLAAAIQRESDAAIVLCGRTSSDYGTGQTGPMLAELLGRPFIGNVTRIEGEQGKMGDWLCTRETPQGYEIVRCTVPFVATVTNAPHNVPRVPGMKHVMQAHRMAIDILPVASLSVPARATAAAPLRVVRRHVPVNLKGCNFLKGTVQEQARALAAYLRNAMPETAAS
jgi:electron transfer flavoprotein beta subunit